MALSAELNLYTNASAATATAIARMKRAGLRFWGRDAFFKAMTLFYRGNGWMRAV
jgi:hypothetical protein